MNSGEIPELIFEQQNSKRTIVHHNYYRLLLQESER